MIFEYKGIQGFDISTWQDSPAIPGDVDFIKMKNWGANFVIMKAGQGSRPDPDFVKNWSNSKGILPRGTYWYYDNQHSPKAQAGTYWSIISQDLEGICWLDLEDRRMGTYIGWRSWYDFLVEFQRLSNLPNEQIGIYTNFFYWIEHLRSANEAELEWFGRFPLWLASYPEDPFNPVYANILCPPPWSSPLMLQSGTPAIGLEAGVESRDIDYNHFNGDAEKFNKYFKASIPTGTSGEPMSYIELKPSIATEYRSIRDTTNFPTTPHIFGASSNRINVGNIGKSEPNAFYVYPADVSVNGVLSAKAGDKWWRVFESNGSTVDGWCSEVHKGVRYLNVRLVDDVPNSEITLTHTIQVYSDGSLVVDGNPIP